MLEPYFCYKQSAIYVCKSRSWLLIILSVLYLTLAETSEESQAASSSEKSNKEDDKDSDISDVEDQEYCDDSSPSNIQLRLRLQLVSEERIRKLYKNTDDVGV